MTVFHSIHEMMDAEKLKRAQEVASELVGALESGVSLIESDLVGADWKQACHKFTFQAHALLARIKGEA